MATGHILELVLHQLIWSANCITSYQFLFLRAVRATKVGLVLGAARMAGTQRQVLLAQQTLVGRSLEQRGAGCGRSGSGDEGCQLLQQLPQQPQNDAAVRACACTTLQCGHVLAAQ